jgi:hypothetical protein
MRKVMPGGVGAKWTKLTIVPRLCSRGQSMKGIMPFTQASSIMPTM